MNLSKAEKKKINRIISFLKKGLTSLADECDTFVKGINDFITSLTKAQRDLKEVPLEAELQTVSTSSKKVVATPGAAKTAAAGTLFALLSGTPGAASAASAAPAAAAAAAPAAPAAVSGAPKPPGGGGPPKAPAKAGPPSAPAKAGPPSRGGNLPPAPKLPPTGSGPPKAPGGAAPTPPGAGAPKPPGGAAPKAPGSMAGPPGGTPAAAAAAGGGLSSLRDEMLEELTRLKKIMRGE